ncbi:MAG: caspase family protein [Woronichinia naegeliana WA131]|jgi:hypothetical protein|uniref:Caspase family protein n=1 Tax=Woronichinia naegeliana WA131 TaxID=2824559 RepID=A0A977KT02_9CYAN|nr:MAG: caspase family protein [Woronichinia naegeliana WA131]
MAKNWAICIGINQYNNLSPLNYAVRDAEAMRGYFTEVGFDPLNNLPEFPLNREFEVLLEGQVSWVQWVRCLYFQILMSSFCRYHFKE